MNAHRQKIFKLKIAPALCLLRVNKVGFKFQFEPKSVLVAGENRSHIIINKSMGIVRLYAFFLYGYTFFVVLLKN